MLVDSAEAIVFAGMFKVKSTCGWSRSSSYWPEVTMHTVAPYFFAISARADTVEK